MKSRLLLALILILAVTPAFAAKVFIDHDQKYDFSSIKTFAWAPTPDTSVESTNPLMHSRIVNAIEHYITMGGTQEVTENPDVYVTYHTDSKEEMQLNTSSYGYGYPGGWGWGGYGYGAGWGRSQHGQFDHLREHLRGGHLGRGRLGCRREGTRLARHRDQHLPVGQSRQDDEKDRKALAKIVKKSKQLELRNQTGG